MNGYRTQIFELHDIPGGLCTAWERQGYIFDGCIHYLMGSGEGQPFNQVWQELGAWQGRDFIHHTEIMRVVDSTGKTLIAYCNPDQLEAHMKELSPADAHLIEAFTQGIRQLTHFDMSLMQQRPRDAMNLMDWGALGLKMMPYVSSLVKWASLSAQEFGARFRDPFLQRAIPQIFGWPEIPVMAGMSVLAGMHTRNAGFPTGGSLEFARSIERRYLELGGQINYKAQVEKILVEGNRAVGVRLYNDDEHRADYVISAADGKGTIFGLLGGEFVNRKVKRTYDGNMPIHAQLQVSYGVKRDLSAEPHWVMYLLDEPLMIAGEKRFELGVKNYCFDPSLAPAGKSTMILIPRANYSYWQHIYGHKLYDLEQIQVSEAIKAFLEKIYPGIGGQIEVDDVATPVSYERYTSNWQGSSCGWLLTKQTMRMMIRGMSKILPGLRNFYMAGQWVEPGGMVPICAMSGRNAVQLICNEEGKTFEADTLHALY